MNQKNYSLSNQNRMPVLFVGHGSPMNALVQNRWSQSFAELASLVGRPKAILVVSAHWYTKGSYVTANASPETIHDFGGFPEELYMIQYPAPGSAELAEKVTEIIESDRSALRTDWGLDHGSWSVLRWMYPNADIPVIQLSINTEIGEAEHIVLARSLQQLRDQGILIVGSGNIVHNLKDAFGQVRSGTNTTPDWAKRFDDQVRDAVRLYDTDAILRLSSSSDGRQAHPTPDHWLPLLYAYGAAELGESVSFPIEGFDWGSISMRAIAFGAR
ncbi:MAG: 4,5-DOPA dioxygenase extradiol [Pseudohongiellaceae bacterium]